MFPYSNIIYNLLFDLKASVVTEMLQQTTETEINHSRTPDKKIRPEV